MALTIKQLSNYSWMSQASYLDFSGSRSFLDELKSSPINNDKILAEKQAILFTDSTNGYSFVSYAPNSPSTGFSATVFKSNADNSYTIAVRGTESGNDFINDLIKADGLGVVLQGEALEQLFVGYRYYKQLTATGSTASYSQQELTAMATLLVTAHDKNFSTALFLIAPIAGVISTWASSLTFAERVQSMAETLQPILNNDSGLGLIPVGATVNFTGHSLGGHVAALLAEMVAQYGTSTVGDIATYNAPGINALSYEIQNWLNVGTATTQTGVLANRIAVVGDGGIDVTAGLGLTNGIVQRTFIETSSDPIDNHSIVKLSDSLVMYDLLKTLSPSESEGQIKLILGQASNDASKSLEKTLDALRQTILGGNPTPTLVTDDTGADARNNYYTNLKTLTDSTAFQSLIGKVTLVAPPTTAAEARDDFGAFLSLFYLTPFALKTSTTEADNALKNANSALRYKWEADNNLTPEQKTNGEANFSDMYLADRAAMLSWLNKRNTEDKAAGDIPDGPDQLFWDETSSTEIQTGSLWVGGIDRRQFLFGDDNKADTLTGGHKNDHLYGLGGADTLSGGDGNDWLEGNADADTLKGGKGNDFLYGGIGTDTYEHLTGDGNDVILDADNLGRIQVDGGAILNGGEELSPDLWQSADKKYKYALYDESDGTQTLNIYLGGERLFVKNFTSGDFGINLASATPAPQVQVDRTILGDRATKDFDATAEGIQSQADDLGNIIIIAEQIDPGKEDFLLDSTGNDLIQSGDGDDKIYAIRGGDDQLDGGAGSDEVFGNAGNDTIIGGLGSDILHGGSGEDKIYAGSEELTIGDALDQLNAVASGLRGDLMDGSGEDDILVGDTGNDVLNGGQDQDLIIAGAGDDVINGDAQSSFYGPDWSVERSVETINNVTFYKVFYNELGYTKETTGADDVIYAGDGSDWVFASYGNDWLDGGKGNDVLFGSIGSDNLMGGTGDDVLSGDDVTVPLAEQGNDFLDGGDGNDQLGGYAGDDTLYGGSGDDRLRGDNGYAGGNDYLDGGSGIDTLSGGDGNDDMHGGADADLLLGEAGSDQLYGDAGNDQIAGDKGGTDSAGDDDFIDGGEGDDQIDGQGGNDVLMGGAGQDLIAGRLGDDYISGGDGADQLQGGLGNDTLAGGGEGDVLFGEEGNDFLSGGDGNDYLLGGLGNDVVDGGEGDDVYFVSSFEGNDHIVDSGGTDWLVFQDVFWGGVQLGVGSLKLTVKSTGQEIHLDDFDPDNPFAAGGIEYFQFADGTVKTKSQMIQELGFTPTGTPEDDVLSGTALNDNITALAGNDIVTARAGNDTINLGAGDDWVDAGAGNDQVLGEDGNDTLLGSGGTDTLNGGFGNDILAGGTGNDTLSGGDGNDIYQFGRGDGQDLVIDTVGVDKVQLLGDLTEAKVAFQRQGNNLIIAVNGTDRLTMRDWFTTGNFQSVTLADGNVLDRSGVEGHLVRNQTPIVTEDTVSASEDGVTQVSGNALSNDIDPEGRSLQVTNPGSYQGAYGSLILGSSGGFSYTLNNASTSVQSLAAGQSVTERFTYNVSDNDPNGAATASSTIVVTIHGTNDAPIVTVDSANVAEDGILSVSGNVLFNDRDVDSGTVLKVTSTGTITSTYGTATLAADGGYTYTLNNASTFVQSLGRNQQTTERFSYNVTDGITSVASSLQVTISGTNDAPVVALALLDQSVSTNTAYSWQVPAGTFDDPDQSDVLAYSAVLADGTALPSWLSFDGATLTFSGRVPRDASGYLDINVTATDSVSGADPASNLSVSDIFRLTFEGGKGGGDNQGGGSQGNEGVGNGSDGSPPGHDYSFNDGPGTSPGNPGAQGGDGYQPQPTAISLTRVQIDAPEDQHADAAVIQHGSNSGNHGNQAQKTGSPNNQADASDSPSGNAPAINSSTDSDNNGQAESNQQLSSDDASEKTRTDRSDEQGLAAEWFDLIQNQQQSAYLNPALLMHNAHGLDSPAENNGLGDIMARWSMLDQLLAAHLQQGNAGQMGSEDTGSGLYGIAAFLGSSSFSGQDLLSLRAAEGNKLQTFSGLKEGVKEVA